MTVVAEGVRVNKDAGSGLDVAAWNAQNPLHPRDADGQWRARLASAIAKIAEDFGEIINREEFGEADHSFSDHGMMSLHADGTMSIHRIGDDDGDVGTVAADLDGQESMVLAERIEMALDELDDLELDPQHSSMGTHLAMDDDDDEDPFPVSVGYGAMSDGTRYIALTDATPDGDGESLQLTQDQARELLEQLEIMRDQQDTYDRDKDNPYRVGPLPLDETLMRRRKVGSDEGDDILLGIVAAPAGRRLRLGLGGNDALPEHAFTGGPGPMVADLGPAEALQLDETISAAVADMKDYHRRQQAFFAEGGPLEQWEGTDAGQAMGEIGADYEVFTGSDNPVHGGNRWIMEYVAEGSHGGRDPGSPDSVHAPAEVYQQYEDLSVELEALFQKHGLINDEGAVFASHEVPTAAGTITIDLIQWDSDSPPTAQLSVRPSGVSAEDWDDISASYQAYARLTPAQLKRVQELTRLAFVDAEGNPVSKAAGAARRVDNQRIAREGRKYWTRSAEGLAKWARKAHPWTSLYRHLVTKMDPETARRLTSSYFKAVFGYAPSARQGKNPVGKG